MSTEPFSTFPVRRRHDAIRVRHHARQVAALLHFPALEQTCIAAGTFALACQAFVQVGRFRVCFRLAEKRLHIDVTPERAGLLRLVKPLPDGEVPPHQDLAWLARHAIAGPGRLFEEVTKQNQEVLAMLHELHTLRQARGPETPGQPHAA